MNQKASTGVALNITGAQKTPLENLTLEAILFKFSMKGALVTVEICVLCGWRISNKFDVVSKTPYSCDTDGRGL